MEYQKISLVCLILYYVSGLNGLDVRNDCNFGYYNETEEKCYIYATTYKGACLIKEQCAWADDENLICNERLECACSDGYRWFRGQCIKYVGFGEDCNDDIECFDGYNLQSLSCVDKKCSCSDGYYEREEGKDCRKKSGINESCVLSSDCSGNQICNILKCEDPSNKIADVVLNEYTENHSIKEMRNVRDEDTCNNNADCTLNHQKCFEGRCICQPGYFLVKGVCIGELGVAGSCSADTRCSTAFQGATCEVDTGTCYCNNFYFTTDSMQLCVKGISNQQTTCSKSESCDTYGPNSICDKTSGTCRCSSYATLNINSYCEIKDTVSGCLRDNDCKIAHTTCLNEQCTCDAGYEMQKNKCIPSGKLGSNCDYDSDCIVDNSTCQEDRLCQCQDGFFSESNDDMRCYKYVNTFNESCDIGAQCQMFNSDCIDGVCYCIADYALYKETECVPDAGEFGYCESAKECKVSNGDLLCRNSVCQCDLYQTLKEHQCSSAIRLINGSLICILVGIIGFFKVFN